MPHLNLWGITMQKTNLLSKLTVPWGRQEIELQEIGFDSGGLNLLRVCIREGKRFTIFDIDAATAAAWGSAMQQWAERQTTGASDKCR